MRQLKCHRCGSADLTFFEAYIEHGEFDGPLFVNDKGNIETHFSGCFTQGKPQPHLNRIECGACGHAWHPRRHYDGSGQEGGS
jgi:hypothetical protein